VNWNDPVSTALLVAEALERAGCRYALMGGLLMAAYGEPCETRDADIAVVDLTVDRAREILEGAGLEVVVAIRDGGVTFGGLSGGRLTLIGGDEHLGLNVLDIVRTRSARYNAAAMSRSVRVPLRGAAIQALSTEDFVVFKALATRDRDLDDAASVLRRSGEVIDLALIDREVDLLSDEIPDFDVRGHWTTIQARGGR
jgi:predicted nucleotidyltransferase